MGTYVCDAVRCDAMRHKCRTYDDGARGERACSGDNTCKQTSLNTE